MSEAQLPVHIARVLPTPADTDRLGRAFASMCEVHAPGIAAHGLQVNLSGELGSGKTSLIRAWLRGFGVSGPVRSPSFAVLEPYLVSVPRPDPARQTTLDVKNVSSLDFYHFDFYRFADSSEFAAAGFRDQFGPGRICAIEWPEKAGERLPTADVSIALAVEDAGRRVTLGAGSELGRACLESVVKEFDSTAAA